MEEKSKKGDAKQGMNAVRKLLEGLDGGGHTNMKDNFFTNIKLFKDLEARGIYVTGTIRNTE